MVWFYYDNYVIFIYDNKMLFIFCLLVWLVIIIVVCIFLDFDLKGIVIIVSF